MTVLDREGADLPDVDAARERAVADARQMACVEVKEGHLTLSHRIAVSDENGDVMTVHFKDAVEVRD
jgi:hypothetical protein